MFYIENCEVRYVASVYVGLVLCLRDTRMNRHCAGFKEAYSHLRKDTNDHIEVNHQFSTGGDFTALPQSVLHRTHCQLK